jgi:hypothetical protein
MELVNVWLPLIAVGILAAIAIGAWFADRKVTAIWFGFGCGVVLLLLLSIHLQQIVSGPEVPKSRESSPDRPWVSVEVEIAGSLAYDDAGWDAGTRWHIPIKFRLTNTGSTPATGVDAHANIMPFMIGYWPKDRIKDGIPQGPAIPGTDAADELKKLCASLASMTSNLGPFMGYTLFKGKSLESLFHINGNPDLFNAARQSPGYSGNILLLVCVTYRAPTDERLHQTGESFAIFRPNAKIDLEQGTVAASELRIIIQPMGGNFAN